MGLRQSSYVLGWLYTNLVKGIVACIIYLGISFAVNGFETVTCENKYFWVSFAYFLYFTSAYA